MKKFEYEQVYINGLRGAHMGEFKKMGLEGWELVCIVMLSQNNNAVAYFKREIPC